MSGSAVGLLFGLGLLLVVTGGRRGGSTPAGRGVRLRERAARLLAEAGLARVSPRQLFAAVAAAALVGFVLAAAISRAVPLAVAFGGFAGWAPVALVRRRRRQRAGELREVWPDVVDNLASAVRAGLALPEALSALAVRGPEPLRPAFAAFARDYAATGRFAESLDRLKARLADPVGDRIVESLRVAREVGGSDLGRLLRTLSQFLREDARTRAELETRQGWTVNAARLALAAPWAVLALLSVRPDTVAAYNSGTGALVLAGGAAVSFLAYRAMLRIARLPDELRVLR